MSLIPSFMQASYPKHIWDQHFGLDLLPDDFDDLIPRSVFHHNYYRPWGRQLQRKEKGSKIHRTADKFQVALDVQQFSPEEITVKVVDDYILVEGKHEEKQDQHGYISRQFVRRYVLPKDYDIQKISSSLSSDGVLTLDAPKIAKPIESGERVIPIARTGPVHAVLDKSEKEPKKTQDMET